MDMEGLTASTADLALGLPKVPLPWCFRCRKFSHVMRNCHLPSPEPKIYLDTLDQSPDLDDFLDEFHKQLSLHMDQPLSVCRRCEDLDFLQLFHMPWKPNFQTTPLNTHRYPSGLIDIVVPGLGEGGTTVFLSNYTQQLQIQRLMTTFIEEKDVPQSYLDLTAMDRKIVSFDASTPPDYVCLSYVWGSVKQISNPLNTTLPRLPQTVEDATTVVRKLGKRYLWVDSLCIGQINDEHKQSQIIIMHEIYRNSWATIVDLSETSSNSGLSRTHTDWFPRQLRHEIDSHQFFSGLPFLLTYAKQSPWSERGWVLQEAMLSRRCIIVTRSQIYFDCNEWQFTETFPTRVVEPPFHERPFKEHRQISTGVFRMTGNQSLRSARQRLHMYSQLLVDYKNRKITYPSDSLSTFSAILIDLIGKIESQFSNGLPIEYMPWPLGWKQKCLGPMRSDFPSWSWAAWDGPLLTGAIEHVDRFYSYAEWFEPYFSVVATDQWNQPRNFHRNVDQHHRWGGREDFGDIRHLEIKNMPFEDLVGETTKPSQTALKIEGVVFKLVVHIPEQPTKSFRGETICHVYIENGEFDIYVTPSESPSELRGRFRGDAQDFLMLARVYSTQIKYELLLLEWRDGIAYRLEAVTMGVYEGDLKLMRSPKPVLKRFWLG
ncbi:hypothetical protein IFR05_002494 [Cadophora sp. M221]|nr:hypothetical protein IFR05_002494 [Cadophora sp. M221]